MAELIQTGLRLSAISEADVWLSDQELWNKLKRCPAEVLQRQFVQLTSPIRFVEEKVHPWRRIDLKIRTLNPTVWVKEEGIRLSDLDGTFQHDLAAFHPSGKDHFGYSYDIVNSIEVWNSAMWPKNAEAIMIWDDMLSSGRKITGRGGSDTHRGFSNNLAEDTPENKRVRFNYIDTPTTWVFAKERTAQAVVDALTNGRVSVSANPYGPRVELYADLNNDGKVDLMMGDNTKSTGKPVKFRVKLAGNTVPGGKYKINIFKNNSNRWQSLDMTDANGLYAEFTDTPSAQNRTFYRVTIEGPVTTYPQVSESMKLRENMVGLSNSIFFNFAPNF